MHEHVCDADATVPLNPHLTQGIKVKNEATGLYGRFDPSLSYRTLCSSVKLAFGLSENVILRFSYIE